MEKGIKGPVGIHVVDILEIKERTALKTEDWEFTIVCYGEKQYGITCEYKDFDEVATIKQYFNSYEEAHKYAVDFIYRRYE